ncbi:MAG: hypothetical protein JST00_20810 [Deltaproteobacteria bacterium]|nr:hypothetical protein [Deltaproteobacteria bacterium]
MRITPPFLFGSAPPWKRPVAASTTFSRASSVDTEAVIFTIVDGTSWMNHVSLLP